MRHVFLALTVLNFNMDISKRSSFSVLIHLSFFPKILSVYNKYSVKLGTLNALYLLWKMFWAKCRRINYNLGRTRLPIWESEFWHIINRPCRSQRQHRQLVNGKPNKTQSSELRAVYISVAGGAIIIPPYRTNGRDVCVFNLAPAPGTDNC